MLYTLLTAGFIRSSCESSSAMTPLPTYGPVQLICFHKIKERKGTVHARKKKKFLDWPSILPNQMISWLRFERRALLPPLRNSGCTFHRATASQGRKTQAGPQKARFTLMPNGFCKKRSLGDDLLKAGLKLRRAHVLTPHSRQH